jgi:Transposase
MPPRASRVLRTCPSRKLWSASARARGDSARVAEEEPIDSRRCSEYCTIWGTWWQTVPKRSALGIPNIGVCTAEPISTLEWTIWPRLAVTTHIGWSRLRSGWSWKTRFLTELRPGIFGVIIGYLSLSPRSKTGSRRGEKRAQVYVEDHYLDWALQDFSGYIAIDELYDGPFCVLSIVDNHTFKRLIYEVLDRDPSRNDIESFLDRFKRELTARKLNLKGVTTDGSPLYPAPLAKIFPGVAHQICEFHILADLTKAVLHAVANVRKQLKARMPKLPKGRPTQSAKRLVRTKKHLEGKVADLFEYRYLFVQHALTPAERRTLHRISRGLPQLRTLRDIMDETYRLFDRRCRTATALAKLARLRSRVRRFKKVGKTLQKLFSPTLEKALTFLDDSLLPSTSNAVERGNRRHRKMQKSIYSVRSRDQISSRIALDMLRDESASARFQTTTNLHLERAGA